jgi:hypothetical protein
MSAPMGRLPFVAISLFKAGASLEGIIGRFVELKREGPRWVGLCPFHTEKTPSFTITPAMGIWKCFGCDAGGDVFAFVMRQQEMSFPEAVRYVAGEIGFPLDDEPVHPPVKPNGAPRPNGLSHSPPVGQKPSAAEKKGHPRLVATYPYPDADQTLLYEVLRYEPGWDGKPKSFRQRRRSPDGQSWVWGISAGWYTHGKNGDWYATDNPDPAHDLELPEVKRVLWRLPQLLEATDVMCPEGEKDVLTLEALGFVATTVSGGSKAPWLKRYSEQLRGKRVVIFPDNDRGGEAHAQAKQKGLRGFARETLTVPVPEGFKDITEYVEAGHGREDVLALIEAAGRGAIPKERPLPMNGLPTICSNGRELRDVRCDALSALQAFNDPPVLFARSGQMVKIAEDEKQRNVLINVSDSALRGYLSNSANYFAVTPKGLQYTCFPPTEVVRDLMALDPALWKFKPLDGVVEAPVLRPNGTILTKPGYDAETLLYYIPDPELRIPEIPGEPTKEHIDQAKELINKMIEEFPFEDNNSKTNFIAAMLTPIVKPAINDCTPMPLMDAPQAGTGKGLLADLVSIAATGRGGEMFSAPNNDEEWRKQITMALRSGTAVVVIDNVTKPLDNADLCKVLTETQHADRAMGTHDKILLPVKSTWIATGNNIKAAGDMPRRCYWVHMDAKTLRPEQREFKIPNLRAWATKHRGDLLAALLTMARYWFVLGKPKPKIKPIGSFELWTTTVGGILQSCGIKGFLGNTEKFRNEADPKLLSGNISCTRLMKNFMEKILRLQTSPRQ